VAIRLRRNVVRNGYDAYGYPALWINQINADNVTFELTDNLFYGNSGHCAIEVDAYFGGGPGYSNADVRIVHNTFADAAQTGLCTRMTNSPKLYNNVFYGSGATDYYADTGHPSMVANSYGTIDGASLASGSSNNLAGNPHFVDAAAHDYRLQPTS